MEVPITATIVSLLLTIIIFYVYRLTNYWKKRGVPSYGNVLTGCFIESFKAKENLSHGLERLYTKTKHEKFVGTYLLGQPLLVLNDPEIIKQVVLTEYPTFASHGIFYTKHDTLSSHLFNLQGQEWKSIRSKMSPTFSSGKIKSMFDTVLHKVLHCDKKMSAEKDNIVVYNDYMRRLSIDIICACFFGIEANCLDEKTSGFWKISYLLNTPVYGQFLNFLLFTHLHKLSDVLTATRLVRFFPKETDNFMIGLTNELVKLRESSSEGRNDFVDMMVKLKNAPKDSNGSLTDDMTVDTIAAQIFVLFGAGFETTSQVNTFAVFEMAKNPEVMKKVQDECDQILRQTGGKITYDSLAKMEYTDKVIKETLRLYPALQYLIRSAIKPCKLPTTDLNLEKDTNLWIPLIGLHKDPQYFPDPERFDPERFSSDNKTAIPPYVYMPFGEGPRTCIGMRFALMSIKTTLLTVMSKYNVSFTEDSPAKVTFEPLVYFPVPCGDYPFKLTPRN